MIYIPFKMHILLIDIIASFFLARLILLVISLIPSPCDCVLQETLKSLQTRKEELGKKAEPLSPMMGRGLTVTLQVRIYNYHFIALGTN